MSQNNNLFDVPLDITPNVTPNAPTPPPSVWKREELELLGIRDLLKIARENGAKGSWLAKATKGQLMSFILSGEVPAPEPQATPPNTGDLGSILWNAIKDNVPSIDMDQVSALIDHKIETFAQVAAIPHTIEIKSPTMPEPINVGIQHKRFEELLRRCHVRDHKGDQIPIYMHGSAGTGKTSAASAIAKAMGLKFYFNGAIDSEYKLSGFIDAQGIFRSRPFYEAYSQGGVYLFDELDSSMPSAVLAFNAALANGHADFPCGTVQRHKDCIIIAAGNTTLRGDGLGQGFQRFEMDAAFRDRFTFLEWELDEDLESAIVGSDLHAKKWLPIVRRIRANVKKHGLKKVEITPRATIAGVAMLRAGFCVEEALEATCRKGLDEKSWDLIKAS